MPVSGEYTWAETPDHIELIVPLKGVPQKKVDIFTASTIVKVAYPPFLLDLNLYAVIEDDKSRAIIKEGTLKISLAKRERELWGKLCFEGSKDEIKTRRQKALKDREETVKQHLNNVATKKSEEERMAFRQHMELERKERQRMEDIKELERRQAEEKMHEVFSELKKQRSYSSLKQTEDHYLEPAIDGPQDAETHEEEAVGSSGDCNYPPPRQVIQATFRHTHRFFKTPSRESTAKQEKEFIIKNRLYLKKNALLNADTNIADIDPVWLLAKGDEFRSRGDFYSAINAYSDALDVDGTMVEVYVSRADCYLQLREGPNCIKDCLDALGSKGIESSDMKSVRKEAHFRLGLAYCLEKQYVKGMGHLNDAREMDDTDDAIRHCIEYVGILKEASHRKDEGDQNFADGNFPSANDCYTKAIELDPLFINALMNRTACHLAMRRSEDCIADSTKALQILQHGKKNTGANILAGLLIPRSSTKRKWIVTLLCRRAAAKRIGSDLMGSLSDMEEALKSARRVPDADLAALENDIASVKAEIASAQ